MASVSLFTLFRELVLNDSYSIRRKAMLHHYLEFIDEDSVAEAGRWSQDLSARYGELEAGTFTGLSMGSGSSECGSGNRQVKKNSDEPANTNLRNRMEHTIPILFPSF